ncbi:hypothetical protein BD309DRAFT_872996 [Dichomitus squalens]|nr:uncharacterized protein DICSQDRAFT_138231 [Dichomitus squalens LYAD-421 SS1]EJF59766.1 hypothetical protein DICSQDRAFT_138231 [Dichomitus squalens LYAD-421 SS1]TBU39117.1 hypothetical protein BD309DRAFT_872996 [Dichomitus squalens]
MVVSIYEHPGRACVASPSIRVLNYTGPCSSSLVLDSTRWVRHASSKDLGSV